MTVRTESLQGVIAYVGAANGSIGSDGNAVRHCEMPIAPPTQKVAFGIENEYWSGPSVEDEDFIVGVDRDPNDIGERPADRSLRPIVDDREPGLISCI